MYRQDLDAVETGDMQDDPAAESVLVDNDVAPPGKSRRNTVQYSRHADDAVSDDDDDDDDDDSAADDEQDVESEEDDDDV